MRKHVCFMMALTFVSWAVYAADAPPHPLSTIESPGMATLETPPDLVEFWLHRTVKGATFMETMKNVLAFGPALRKELAAMDIGPFELAITAPALKDIKSPQMLVSAKIQINMNTFNSRETGPEMFAQVCDSLTTLAAKLECPIEGPVFSVQDKGAIERSAIALAVENALPAAQTVAEMMNAFIGAVDSVAIQECAWNAPPDTQAATPDMRRLTCTAHVRVTYAFSTSAP